MHASNETAREGPDSPHTTSASPDGLTAFQRDVLAVIAGHASDGPYTPGHAGSADVPHGVAIRSVLEDRYGTDVNHGRLYQNLDSLVDEGLVEKTMIDARTNGYTLTPAGTEFLHRHVRWESVCLGDTVNNGRDSQPRAGGATDD